MKPTISLFCALFFGLGCLQAFETWTNRDGRSVQLKLLSVTEVSGEKVGEFEMQNGRIAKLKASDLSIDDAKRLADWKPAPVVPPSVFDRWLDGNLVKLEGKSLKRCDYRKPTKYYLFYYTASWCPPCQKFTPKLVEFYDAQKPKSDAFEIILVTSDEDEKSMEEYSVDKKMNWPQLKFSKVEAFKKNFRHPGRGIPNLVLTDIDGNILKTSYVGDEYYGPTPVMRHLGQLLE